MFKNLIKKIIIPVFLIFSVAILIVGCKADLKYQIDIEDNGAQVKLISHEKLEDLKFGTDVSFEIASIPDGYLLLKVMLGETELYPVNNVYSFKVRSNDKIEVILVNNSARRSITYLLNGGTNHPDNPSSFSRNGGKIILEDATKFGHTFLGWYLDDELVVSIDSTIDRNITLYAKFEITEYKITYELDGGTNHQDNPSSYTILDDVVFRSAIKEDFHFKEWQNEAGDKVEGISVGTSGDLKLKAIYIEKSEGAFVTVIKPNNVTLNVTNGVNINDAMPLNTEVKIKLEVPTGFELLSVKYDSISLTPVNDVYTFSASKLDGILEIITKEVFTSPVTYDYEINGTFATTSKEQVDLVNSKLRSSGTIREGDGIQLFARANLWTYGAYFTAVTKLYLADKTDANKQLVLDSISELDWYRAKKRSDDHLVYASKGGDETPAYYDDNIWIVIGFLQAYEGLENSEYLDKAKQIMEWIYTGWDTKGPKPGGIYWREFPSDTPLDKLQRNTCINGPAAWANAWLYQITGTEKYLQWAIRIYDWTKAVLYNSNDKLFSDNIKANGNYDYWQFTYNTGTMISAASYLYEITNEVKYKNDVLEYIEGTQNTTLNDHFLILFDVPKEKADESRNYEMSKPISDGDFYKDNPWFRVYLFQGFLDAMKRVDPNIGIYLERSKRALIYGLENQIDAKGFLAEDWVSVDHNKGYGDNWGSSSIKTLNAVGNVENIVIFDLYEQYLEMITTE